MEVFQKISILMCAMSVAIGDQGQFKWSPRILGGAYYFNRKHPYLVSLRRFNESELGSTEHFCGAAILNKRWIITSAHCTSEKMLHNQSDLLIGVGKNSFQSKADILKMHRAEHIVMHPKYVGDKMYDISLIKTEEDIEFNAQTQPVKLSKEWIDEKIGAAISGWGLIDVSTINSVCCGSFSTESQIFSIHL